jgi:hypothetical protein
VALRSAHAALILVVNRFPNRGKGLFIPDRLPEGAALQAVLVRAAVAGPGQLMGQTPTGPLGGGEPVGGAGVGGLPHPILAAWPESPAVDRLRQEVKPTGVILHAWPVGVMPEICL